MAHMQKGEERELTERFGRPMPESASVEVQQKVCWVGLNMATVIARALPAGDRRRETAIALVEQAVDVANAGIARQHYE